MKKFYSSKRLLKMAGGGDAPFTYPLDPPLRIGVQKCNVTLMRMRLKQFSFYGFFNQESD